MEIEISKSHTHTHTRARAHLLTLPTLCAVHEQDLICPARLFGENIQFLCEREEPGGRTAPSKQQLLRLCHSSREQGLAVGGAGSRTSARGSSNVLALRKACFFFFIFFFSNKTGLLFEDGEGKHGDIFPL